MLQRRGGAVKAGGVEFFPDRDTLHRAYGSIGARFSRVSSVDAIWVVGLVYFLSGERTGVVKRLLLPDPEGTALRHVMETANVAETIKNIKDVTAAARKGGTKVKWYDNFLYHSIILADLDKPSGWIHVESVFPYSKSMKRPSWTLSKRQSEEAVMEMRRIFDEIWHAAKEPPLS
jgi:hypothetical protein